MVRYGCDHCGETWDEDNLDLCVVCQADTCPRCATIVSIVGREPEEWWCNRCLEAIGRLDLTKWQGPPEERGKHIIQNASSKAIGAANLKMSMRWDDGTTTLDWDSNVHHREIMASSLKITGFDISEGSSHFKVPPALMPPESGFLVFTKSGRKRLNTIWKAFWIAPT